MLNKKFYFLTILVGAVLLVLVLLIPLYRTAIDYVTLYRQAFVEPFPRIELDDGSLTFLDPVPVKISIDDKVEIICEKEPDLDYFENTPKNSVLISESLVVWKSDKKFESFDVKKIEIDNDEPLIIEPVKVSQFIDKYSKIILGFAGVVLFVLYFLISLLIVLMGGGIGFMIDAFQDGNISFTFFTNISALLFLGYQTLILLFYKFGFLHTLKPLLFFMIFLVSMALISLLLRNLVLNNFTKIEIN